MIDTTRETARTMQSGVRLSEVRPFGPLLFTHTVLPAMDIRGCAIRIGKYVLQLSITSPRS